MGDLAERKTGIMQAVSQMQGEREIAQLEAFVRQIQEQEPESKKKYGLRKIPKKFDAEAVRRSRGYRKPDKEEFMRIIREMNVQEPVEELLAMLTK